ncbi:MAG: hypothetical protein OFPII_30140 [Osedax symbiont Rs1]|nr:MAG: hypothetical protein OFPII_30140 [Osedax symbiont Rs1]
MKLLPKILQKCIVLSCCFFTLQLSANSIATLTWEDLIPESERVLLNIWQRQAASSLDQQSSPLPSGFGKVRSDLNGQIIKIPGFAIPLEGGEHKITEFLLVPYFGACYHVPPPPENQIIHVVFKDGVEFKELWDVVYIVGKLRTQAFSHELAEVGYQMEGIRIEEYREVE